MYRDFQARLGMKHDPIRRKLLDNTTELIGAPTDCLRIRVQKNDEGDKERTFVERADVVSIVFPPMVDVPYRIIAKEDATGSRSQQYRLTSLVTATTDDDHQKHYEIIAPHSVGMNIGDLVCRVFQDPEQEFPVVIVTEVSEMLGTVGFSAMVQHKYRCVINMDKLPNEVVGIIAEMAERRLRIRF